MEKVFILGASGLVGSALINELKDGFELYGTYCSTVTNLPEDKQFQLDVQQIDKLKELLASIKPDMVISCLRGEFDLQFKFHEELAIELRKTNSRLYYFSTTNVFDGDFTKAHTEMDFPIAESDYGDFKIKCENMLMDILADRVVMIRIPAIWGKDSPRWNLIIESIRNNVVIDVYNNLICNNLTDVMLAKQLRYIIENKLKGIFHLGSVDMVTQGLFYEQLISSLGADKGILRFRLFLEHDDTYYFALKSTRAELPDSLQCTNKDIISYLLGSIVGG